MSFLIIKQVFIMDIIYKATSVVDFADALKKRIQYLDMSVFETPLKVEIFPHKIYPYKGVAAFTTKRLLFKFFGLKNSYMIFTQNQDTEVVSKREYTATCIAAHEVRHRFQEETEDTLISFNFLRQRRYIPQDRLEQIYLENWEKFSTQPKLFLREFDSAVIEYLIMLGYKHKNFSMETVVQLIQCNEKTLGSILNDVINPKKI